MNLNINFCIFSLIHEIVAEDQAATAEDSYNDDDEDSCGSTVGVGGATGPTPPDSPQMGREKVRATRSLSQQYQYTGKIIPEFDIYAIPCKEGTKFQNLIVSVWGPLDDSRAKINKLL